MKQTVQNRLGALEQAASAGGRSVPVDLLATAMRDPSAKVRSKAVQIVAEHGVEAAVPLVEKLLDDPSDEVRMSAVQSLGCFPASSSVSLEKLKSLLTDSSQLVRIETLEVLASLDDKDVLPAIAQLLRDADPLVRDMQPVLSPLWVVCPILGLLKTRWVQRRTTPLERVFLKHSFFWGTGKPSGSYCGFYPPGITGFGALLLTH